MYTAQNMYPFLSILFASKLLVTYRLYPNGLRALRQVLGQDLEDNESVLQAVNQEAYQLLEELKQSDAGLVDMEGFEAQLRLVNDKWQDAKIQVSAKFVLTRRFWAELKDDDCTPLFCATAF